MRRLSADVALPALAAACAAAVLVLPAGSITRGLAGVVLVAVLPGAAFARAVLPDPDRAPERLLVALGMSATIVALAAIALDVVGVPLERAVWAPVLVVLTAAASIASIVRRRDAPRRSFSLPRIGRTDAVNLVLASAVICVAVWLGTTPLRPPPGTPGYTALWMEPERAGLTAVVVSSAETRPTRYRLVLKVGAGVLGASAPFTLAPGQRFRADVQLPPGPDARVTTLLYRVNGGASRLYRRAQLPQGAAVSHLAAVSAP
jgi:hypothetical protein